MFKKKNKVIKQPSIKEVTVPTQPLNVSTIAVVLDNKVEEVLMAEGRLAALLLSNPEFVEVKENNRPQIGWEYDGEDFFPLKKEESIDEKE